MCVYVGRGGVRLFNIFLENGHDVLVKRKPHKPALDNAVEGCGDGAFFVHMISSQSTLSLRLWTVMLTGCLSGAPSLSVQKMERWSLRRAPPFLIERPGMSVFFPQTGE